VRVARRLLQHRAAQRPLEAAAVGALRRQAADAAAEVTSQLRALWTLHVTGNLDDALLESALNHPSETVRAWAVQLGTERPDRLRVPAARLAALARGDTSAAVRLAVAAAIPALPVAERWVPAAALAAHGEDAGDRFLPKMTWSALAPAVAADLPRALALAAATPLREVADSILWFVARTAPGREEIASRIASWPEAAAGRALRVLAFSLENDAGLTAPPSWTSASRRFAASGDAGLRAALEQLSALFGDKSVLGPVRARLADPVTPLAERRRALDLLRRAGDTESTALLVSLLDDRELRAAVIPLLGISADTARAAEGLISRFGTLSGADRNAALAAFTSRPALAISMLRAVEAGRFDRKVLTALHARQLRKLNHPEVNAILDRVWGRAVEASADAKATIARLRDVYNNAPLWSYELSAGRKVFERACSACHGMGGDAAGKLGPDLGGTWRNGLDYFLENIVDPNAVVGAAYEMHVVTKRDGTVLSGMIDRETDTAVVIRGVTETVTVAKSEIRDRQKTTQSLMPAGLLEALPERETLELLKFLTTEAR
jgi:putative heme-binding domain-containing protein